MRKIIQLFILLITLSGFSQRKYTISGIITDSQNGETLLGAAVILKGTSIGTITNEYGFYSITASQENYTLIVSYLGYKTIEKKITLQDDLKFNVELKEDANQLQEIVLTVEESKKLNLREPQMSVSKLKTNTIKKMPAVLGEIDIIKSIQLLPGVTNNGEGSAGFNVRGGAVDQNLVLLDEAVVYNTSHLFGFFSVFNTDAVKDIALYRGTIPAHYGGRISSVLDVHQKEGNKKQFKLTGGIGAVSSRLTAELPLFKGKGSFLVAGRSSYIHLFLKEDQAAFYDLNLKGNYEINEKNKIFLSGYLGRDSFELSKTIESSYGNITGNLRWNYILNDRLFSNLSLIYSSYDYELDLNFAKFNWIAGINNLNLKYDLEYYINDKVTFDFGSSVIDYTLNPGEIKPTATDSSINEIKLDEQHAFEAGIYASMEHKVLNNLTLSYGVRWSYFDRVGKQSIPIYANNQPIVFNSTLGIYEEGEQIGVVDYGKGKSIKNFSNLEPRLGLAYQLNDNSSFKVGYSRTAQYLHLLSNTQSATPLDVWMPSGNYIKPQLSDQYAIGYFRTFNNKMFSLELEGYYKTVNNRIDYIEGAELIGNNTIETEILSGEMRAYGLEVLFRKSQGKLTGWLAYTLSKAEQRTPGGRAGGFGIANGDWYLASHDRTHDFSLTGSYQFDDKWNFGANLAFQTGRPVTYPTGQFQYQGLSFANYGPRNSERLPSYHRLDLSATWRPNRNPEKRWKGEWVFSLYNVYNRKNAASITFDQNRLTGRNQATRTAIFGIIPSITYNFKF